MGLHPGAARGFSNNLGCVAASDGVENTSTAKFGESDIDGAEAEHGGGSEEREKASVGSDTKKEWATAKFVGRGGQRGVLPAGGRGYCREFAEQFDQDGVGSHIDLSTEARKRMGAPTPRGWRCGALNRRGAGVQSQRIDWGLQTGGAAPRPT